jgi:hypothetical protein
MKSDWSNDVIFYRTGLAVLQDGGIQKDLHIYGTGHLLL